MKWQFIRYLPNTTLPKPWEVGWGAGMCRTLDAQDLPVYDVARAPVGTPIPQSPGIEPFSASIPTTLKEVVSAAWSRGVLHRRFGVSLYSSVEEAIEAAWGVPHLLAPYAPTGMSPDKAKATYCKHTKTNSDHVCAVVRTAPRGFDAFTGIGSFLRYCGNASSYEEAEALAIQEVLLNRKKFDRTDIQVLRNQGWPGDTPMWSTSIDKWVLELPITIRRGPLFSSTAGVSWDLPVVGKWCNGKIERFDVSPSWDDEAERKKWRSAYQAGEDRVQTAVELLRQDPRFKGLVRAHDLVREDIPFQGRMIRLCGPVKWDTHRKAPAILACNPKYPSHRYWVPVIQA